MKQTMVVGFMFNENETEVLLIEKNKPEWQLGKMNGIGGKVEQNETCLDAMVREFKEETGISCSKWEHIITMSGDDWEVLVYTTKTNDVFYFETMEEEKVHLISITDLDKYDHVPNLRWLIPMCLDNIGYGIYKGEILNKAALNSPNSLFPKLKN